MLRLKENPREWQKFVAVMGVSVNLPAWLLWWRGKAPLNVALAVAVLAVLVLLVSLVRPGWFRGFYRLGMSVSYHMGLVFGKVLLTVFFFVIVTPLGWLLRLLGKDLLHLQKNPGDKSWWHPAKNSREFDRMY